MKKSILFSSPISALLLLYAVSALATPALTFNPAGGGTGINQNQSVGWEFNVLAPLTVTGVSWWDQTGTGLPMNHAVGIWDPNGVLIYWFLVPSGTILPLDGQFRTTLNANNNGQPITLAVGNGYIVGGEEFAFDTERLACGSGGNCNGSLQIVTDPRIAFVNGTYSQIGSGFTRPTLFSSAHDGFFGPSFSVASAAVPEPATILLLGSGLIGLVGLRRKLKN